MKHVLFVCSQNRLRSPTAERIFRDVEGVRVRSAGIYEESRTVLDKELLNWADMVFVMEEWQRDMIEERFPGIGKSGKRIMVLGIEDIYNYMDPVLVRLLRERMRQYFG